MSEKEDLTEEALERAIEAAKVSGEKLILKATVAIVPANVKPKARRGFAAMSPDKRKEIARKGGLAMPNDKRAFSKNNELAKRAGKKGGEATRKNIFNRD